MAGLGGVAEPKPGDFLVHHGDIPQRGRGLYPAVILQPLLHPAVVEALRRLVQHQLQDGLAGPDLEEAGAPSPGAPVPLAVLAHVAPPRVSPFVFGMSSHGVTELRTRPHSMCAQKTCFVSAG